MNKQANTQASTPVTMESAPVEISLDLLKQVSGGSPKGGWIVSPTESTAQSLSAEAPSPKGGW